MGFDVNEPSRHSIVGPSLPARTPAVPILRQAPPWFMGGPNLGPDRICEAETRVNDASSPWQARILKGMAQICPVRCAAPL